MTWQILVTDRDGDTVVADLPWMEFSFTHVLNGPGSAEIIVSMTRVTRDQIEPGQRLYQISQDGTLRAAGRIVSAVVDAPHSQQTVRLIGEGIAGVLTHRLIDWQARYEPVEEDPPNLNTVYGADTSQELILWDVLERAQAEAEGDLGITQGTHTGGTHLRRRWWCEEDGLVIAEVFDDFASLSDGVDWAITPTLTDSSLNEFVTWNPARGTDLSGTIWLDGEDYLDTFTYEIDASQVITRARSVAEGDCEPPQGDVTAIEALNAYGLLEAFEPSNSDVGADAVEVAEALISPHSLVGADLWYELTKGPALGTYDIGDILRVTSGREGWTLDIDARLQEVEVHAQLPNDDEHTFVRLNFSDAAAFTLLDLDDSSSGGGGNFAAEVLVDDPVGYWKLGEASGSTAFDSSGHGNHGTFHGSLVHGQPSLVGDSGTSTEFIGGGSGGYVTIPDAAVFHLDEFTIEGWVLTDVEPFAEFPYVLVENFVGPGGYNFQLSGSDGSVGQGKKVHVGFYDGASTASVESTDRAGETIYHVVGTYDGTTLKLYIDGSLVDSDTPAFSPLADNDGLQINHRWDASGQIIACHMQHIALYDHALTAARVLAHYEAGS